MSEQTKDEIDEDALENARKYWRADFRRRVNIMRHWLFGEHFKHIQPDPPTPITEGDE